MTIAQAMQQAVTHHMAGRFAEAEPIYRAILGQMPDNAHAMNYLGLVLVKLGQKDEGIKLLRKSVYVDPGVAQFPANLAGALLEVGELPAAESASREAIRRAPADVQSHINLGQALWKQSRREEGITASAKAVELAPNRADSRSQLGLYLLEAGRATEAADQLSRALQLEPSPANHANLGNAMLALHNYDAAVDLYRRAIALKPNVPEYHHNLMLSLSEAGRSIEAIAPGRRAVELRPDFFEAWLKLAELLKATSPPDEAIAAYQSALALKPDHVLSIHNIGMLQALTGQVREGTQTIRRAIALQPDDLDAAFSLAFIVNFHPDCDASEILQENLNWAARFAKPLAAQIRPHDNDRNPDRRLRIGYVSPDFRKHCQALFTIPFFSHHNHEAFEIICYADLKKADQTTERIQGLVDGWRDISGKSDEQVAELIRADRIDILVDLTLQLADNRLLAFARKPAPVQVTWLAYPGSSGLEAIDYRLSDPYLDPFAADGKPHRNPSAYTEKTICLPDTFWCYDPAEDVPVSAELPAEKNGYITFGCLNNFMKVNEGVLDLWAKVMAATPQSRLLLLAPLGSARHRVAERMSRGGIDSSRLEFIWRQPRPQYLEMYQRVDLGLDTFPYNGHTTSLDSFWMGVPVVTLIGKTVVGRAGWSLLSNLGLRKLAAQTAEEFVRIAVSLAGDLPRLKGIRDGLRQRTKSSPLMDGKKFAAGMEAVYRDMWRAWCDGSSSASDRK